MVYLTYAEGFTAAGDPIVGIGGASVLESIPASSCPVRVSPTQAQICLPVEVVENTEIGFRSDWLDSRLRFNATYFKSNWDGMRIDLLPTDQFGNTQPFPYANGEGKGKASGWEFEFIWVPTDRLTLNAAIGLIDTEYIQAGVLTVFRVRRASRATTRVPRSHMPRRRVARWVLDMTFPWGTAAKSHLLGTTAIWGTTRATRRIKDGRRSTKREPRARASLRHSQTRVLYQPAAQNYTVELWGKNLLDELYINGGFDTRDTWGYDFSIVGRSREVGLGLSFTF